ncbi:MAG: SPFH domain-containing protein [Kiritimatiellia bacterium]
MDDAKIVTPPPPPRGARRASGSSVRSPLKPHSAALPVVPFLILIAIVLLPLWVWFWWRIEPEAGEIAVLIKKTGKNLPVEEIIATSEEYKGVQLKVLPEGRFFKNPYVYSWSIIKATDIPAGKFGVLVRKYGQNLPGGEIIALDGSFKGIVGDVLGTGKHRINPYAYEIKLFDDIKIAPGHVGVVTSLVGADLLSATNAVAYEEDGFLASPGWKGVRREVLKEGTHRLNPYLNAVSIVNIQSQRFEFSGEEAIMFLTLDGFMVTVEGTLEINLNVDRIAKLTHEVGDMEDIMSKLIFPSAHGFFRIEGSKLPATEFIVGESRQAFQNSLEVYLRDVCAEWGISLNSVLIRDIIVPQEIAGIVRDRELAAQEAMKFEQQIVQAKSKAELEKQNALAEQNRLMVDAETEKIRQLVMAEQGQLEKTIAASTELAVTKVKLQAAKADAEALLTLAEANRKVIEAKNKADAEVLKQQVSVYKDESDYVRARLYEVVAPNIESILATDKAGDLFGLPVKVYPATPAKVAPAPKSAAQPAAQPPASQPAAPAAAAQKGGAQ